MATLYHNIEQLCQRSRMNPFDSTLGLENVRLGALSRKVQVKKSFREWDLALSELFTKVFKVNVSFERTGFERVGGVIGTVLCGKLYSKTRLIQLLNEMKNSGTCLAPSRIDLYPVQRHKFPSKASSISSSLNRPRSSNAAYKLIAIPGVQNPH